MASSKYSDAKERRRRISDDVTSLDSWSELTADTRNESKSDGTKEDNELVLNPKKLFTIEEPPEPQLMRVGLQKSAIPKIHDGNYLQSSKFLRMPQSDRVPETPENESRKTEFSQYSHKHKKHKKEKLSKELLFETCDACNKTVEDTSRMKDATEPRSLDSRDMHDLYNPNICDCSDCLESNSGHKSLPILSSLKTSHENSKSSQNFLKKHASSPFLQTKKTADFDNGEIEQSEKVKNKIMSVWNNVRYGK